MCACPDCRGCRSRGMMWDVRRMWGAGLTAIEPEPSEGLSWCRRSNSQGQLPSSALIGAAPLAGLRECSMGNTWPAHISAAGAGHMLTCRLPVCG